MAVTCGVAHLAETMERITAGQRCAYVSEGGLELLAPGKHPRTPEGLLPRRLPAVARCATGPDASEITRIPRRQHHPEHDRLCRAPGRLDAVLAGELADVGRGEWRPGGDVRGPLPRLEGLDDGAYDLFAGAPSHSLILSSIARRSSTMFRRFGRSMTTSLRALRRPGYDRRGSPRRLLRRGRAHTRHRSPRSRGHARHPRPRR